MELGDAIHSAVTTRYFSDEPVTDEQLKTAFDYARFTSRKVEIASPFVS